MIKFDVQKSIQYRYIKYKFKRECLKNEALQNLSEDEKEKILMKATKNTRKITWLIITIYIPVVCWFIFGFIGNSKYVDNTFVKWFIGIYEGDVSHVTVRDIGFCAGMPARYHGHYGHLCLTMDIPALERNNHDFPHCRNWFLRWPPRASCEHSCRGR